MRTRVPYFRPAIVWLLVMVAGSSVACGTDEAAMGPSTGDLQVTVTATGDDIPGAFTVTVAGEGRSISPSGSVTFASLEQQSYDIDLSVPANCRVLGSNPRNVPITADAVRRETLGVTCESLAPPGGAQ